MRLAEIRASRAAVDDRIASARRALDAARDERARNRSCETASAVAIAQLHFDQARRAAARWDVV